MCPLSDAEFQIIGYETGVAVDVVLQHKQFQGLSCPAFPSCQGLSPHSVFFMCVLKTCRHFLQRSHSSSAFALEKGVTSSSHHSCGPGAPFEPSLRPSDSDTNPAGVPASSCVPALLSWANPQEAILGWPQHIPVRRELPVPRAGLSYSLAEKLRLCQLHGSPQCFCIPGSCWAQMPW